MTSSPQKKYTLKPVSQIRPNKLTIDYASELNPQQLEAVRTTKGAILCIAGAGSGKTRTLVFRVAYLIEQGVSPEQILLLTFTRKAANEMMKRATFLLDERCKNIKGGTFHSFANSILRRFYSYAGLEPNFNIIDRSDAEDLLNLLRTELGLAKNETRFPKKRTLLAIFSKSINTGQTIQSILNKEYPQFESDSSTIERLHEKYQLLKRSRSMLDYDDLLVELRLLLSCNPEVCQRLSTEHKYIMIDEFQDTNHLQAEISHLLASQHGNILAVGDDAQSIYSFRGAEFRNIMDFPEKYPDCKKIILEQNYRSTQPVLDFANAILETAEEKHPKKLFTNINSEQKPVFLRPSGTDEQASFITQRILELREEGVDLNDIAVLFRASWHSNELEVHLQNSNIPFVKYGGLKFIEAAHIKDFLALLRVCKNFKDEVAWYRILLLFEGIGPKTGGDITRSLVEGNEELNALMNYPKKKFTNILQSLRKTIIDTRSLFEIPEKAILNLKDFYMPILKEKYDDYTKRVDDIYSLIQISEKYKSIQQFMDDLTLEAPDTNSSQSETEPTTNEDEYLTLSTIHSAKGLEWHTVFILNLIDGMIPSSRALNSTKEIEEERRLLYVACTRAKKNLYLSSPEQGGSRSMYTYGGGYGFSEPSRFISQISNFSELTESWYIESDEFDW